MDTDERAGTGHGDVGTTGNLHGDVRDGLLDGFLVGEHVSFADEDRVLVNETKCLGDLFGRYFFTPTDEPGTGWQHGVDELFGVGATTVREAMVPVDPPYTFDGRELQYEGPVSVLGPNPPSRPYR